ncbi:MAG TPA: hypothetical protein VGG02_14495 [Chthoniobacterales bacterium]|jgi:hypothetical protein
MYNKLFTSILDSSIWLEEPATKVVWITLLATMDEDGFARFATPKNLANRAVLSLEETEAAVTILESPDANSTDTDHEGRRIERVPGGWMVLNARKYHAATTRAIARQKSRERVTRFRQKKRIEAEMKCPRNADVTLTAQSSSENSTSSVTPETCSSPVSDTNTEPDAKTVHYTVSPIPDGYSDISKPIIALWHEIACRSGLNFLPVNQFSAKLENAIAGYPNVAEARKLIQYVVDREREHPSRLTKSLTRVLSDLVTGEGLVDGFCDSEDEAIPF